MAADLELLTKADQSGSRFLRLYRWDPPTLSLGRNQTVDGLGGGGLATVRRPTGGTAVWHEHELTYAVAAPVAAFGSLRAAYRTIHERLAGALRALGADVVLAARPPAPPSFPPVRTASCFAAPLGGEIVVHGRKLVGSAQVRRGGAFLQHGSILLAGSQAVARGPAGPSSGSGETTLAHVLGRPVSFAELAEAIIAAWEEPFGPSGLASPSAG